MRQQRQSDIEVLERKDEPAADQRRPELHKTANPRTAAKSSGKAAGAVAGHPAVQEFAAGVDGVAAPAPGVVQQAERAVQAAINYTVNTHITVDEDDGSLDFHLRLADGLLVMANLFADGAVDASVYDDRNGIPVQTVRRMRRTTTQAEDLVRLFQGGIDADTKR